jgi:diamine N-acetyltransferase
MSDRVAFALEAPRVEDAAALSACAQAIFRETFSYMNYPPSDLDAFLDSAMGVAAYAVQIADPAYALRVARDPGGGMVGFVKAGPNDLPMPDGEPPRERTYELHQLYLTDAAKGSGIADRMMAFVDAEARARGAEALYLSVFIENIRAQRFYARHGYVEIGRNPFPVGTVIDDDRVWRKWL